MDWKCWSLISRFSLETTNLFKNPIALTNGQGPIHAIENHDILGRMNRIAGQETKRQVCFLQSLANLRPVSHSPVPFFLFICQLGIYASRCVLPAM